MLHFQHRPHLSPHLLSFHGHGGFPGSPRGHMSAQLAPERVVSVRIDIWKELISQRSMATVGLLFHQPQTSSQ